MPLPPRGSAQDELYKEVMRRERSEKLMLVEVFARILGRGLNLPDASIDSILGAYRQELTQARYHPASIELERRKKKDVATKKTEDLKLLSKLDSLTAKEEKTTPEKGKRRRR